MSLKLNNPGNLRIGKDLFLGEIAPSSDPNFRQFSTMVYGYRALLKQLRLDIARGQNTIETLIKSWAPPTENDTATYIKNVSIWAKIPANFPILLNDSAKIQAIASGISRQENGVQATPGIISQAWDILTEKKN